MKSGRDFSIEDIDESIANDINDDIDDIKPSSNRPPSALPSSSSHVLTPFNESLMNETQKRFQETLQSQTKQTDDSKTAYGNQYASTFGQREFAPAPEPSAPPLNDEEWEEFQAWMQGTTQQDRSAQPHHERWSHIINQGQEKFPLNPENILHDPISDTFHEQVRNGEHRTLFEGNSLSPRYSDPETYMPIAFTAQRAQGLPYFDQVREMIVYSDEKFKTGYVKGKLTGQEIESNHFYVVSDHGGDDTGTNLQIWGPGVKVALSVASAQTKQSLSKVKGSEDRYDYDTSYAHVNNRFTIIRINDNELGFVLERASNRIQKIPTGRYVISERQFAYIGKTVIQPAQAALRVPVHPHNRDSYITTLAEQLQIVLVPPGQVAFAKDNANTYVLTSREQPYVLEGRHNHQFINFASFNQQIIRAADNSYSIVNQLQTGQFILFQYQGQTIVWPYHANNPQFNSLHLPNNTYQFEGNIHTINTELLTFENVHIVNMKPGKVLVVRDHLQQVRFIEERAPRTLVLRTPWELIGLISQNMPDYRAGSHDDGNEIVRLMLRSSEWAAVLDKTGHLAFYPPRLDNKPYYFLQPDHTVIQVINKNTMGEIKLDVPGIGTVSVVNIPSGSIGACRIRNAHFFLNPAATPYILVPPDAFINIIDANEAHIQVGDLHRIVLKPEERAIISKDGKLYRLPPENIEENQSLSEENGVYVFRSFQLKFYGPEYKGKKSYTLGPIQYFNVGVGEVAYGTLNKQLKIWGPGEHSVDNRKNEWFTDFFSTNVDPVQIDKLGVTFKHGITGLVSVYVSYHIVDPEKAIRQFRNHALLHEFIEKTTSSEMLKLCSSRPPLGYSELYFSSNEGKNITDGTTDVNKTLNEIENSFKTHAEQLLVQYGVHISNMYIDKWELAKDFVSQVQANAKRLQDSHAQLEQSRIALEQAKLANEKEIQRKNAEIQFKELENKRLQLDLEAARLQKANESKTKADAQIVQAEAVAKVNEQDARGKAAAAAAEAKNAAEIAVAKAKAQADIAEQEAKGKTAAQRIEADTLTKVAESQLAAKQMDIKAKQLEIEAAKQQGLAEADMLAAKEQAKYAGLTPEQRTQIITAELAAKNLTAFLELMLKTGIQMPGAVTLDPNILQILQLPAIASTQQQLAARNPFLLFAPAAPTTDMNPTTPNQAKTADLAVPVMPGQRI